MDLFETLLKLLGGDLSKEEGLVVTHVGLRLFWRVAVLFFMIFAMGWLSFAGVVGFARADDVDKKIAQQVLPLTSSIAQLAEAVKRQSIEATEQTLQNLRAQIVDARTKWCKAPKAETAAIYRQIVMDAQAHYYNLTQKDYPAPSCADL